MSGIFAFIALQFLGHGSEALHTLKTDFTHQFEALLSLAVGGISALLMPTTERPPTPPEPLTPHTSNPPPPADESTVPLTEYNRVRSELEKWQTYGLNSKEYIRSLEEGRSVLDTRQTVLRASMYGIVFLAFFLCIAGFAAPSLAPPKVSIPIQHPIVNFFPHLGYLLVPFFMTGILLGVVVYRVRATTTGYKAFRCALIASSLVGLVSTLTSLPYTFSLMWAQRITAGGVTMPMLLWMSLFRLIFTPCVCAIFGYLGFQIAKMAERPQTLT